MANSNVSHTVVALRELSDTIATQRMYKWGAKYQSPDADVAMNRYQCAILYAHMLAAGSDQTLLQMVESIVVPASKGRHEGYQRRLREMMVEGGINDNLVIERAMRMLEPRVEARYDDKTATTATPPKKRKLWFPGDPPPKKGK